MCSIQESAFDSQDLVTRNELLIVAFGSLEDADHPPVSNEGTSTESRVVHVQIRGLAQPVAEQEDVC